MRKIRTVTIEMYHPRCAPSYTVVDVMYYGRHMHKVAGPNDTKEWSLHMAKAWAYDNGFTHFRMLGERAITLLEAPKCNTTH